MGKKKYDERSVQGGGKEGWWWGGSVGVSASEPEPMKSEMGAGSSWRRCYCHSEHPPGPHVLDVTGLAQIMPA